MRRSREAKPGRNSFVMWQAARTLRRRSGVRTLDAA